MGRTPSVRGSRDLEAQLQRHERELFSFALRLTGREEAARDCVQDTFLKACQALRQGSSPENLRAWLYRLAYHASMDLLRRSSADARARDRLQRPSIGIPDPPGGLEEIVGSLPSPHREILFLRYAHDFTYEEMEEILGRPAATLRVYAARGIERVHEKLKEDTDGV